MNNIALNICAICGNEIKSLGFESRIIRSHQDRFDHDLPDLDAILEVNEFNSDLHLNCRILCARYYLTGLKLIWYSSRKFEIAPGNSNAYQTLEQLKTFNYHQLQSNGVYLFGKPGLGKSHLLADLCKNLCKRGVNPSSIYWGNTSSILTTLRSSMGKKYDYGEETAQEKISDKLKAKYLFLDDLGTESASDWAKEILYEAINYRYEEQLPLFVTSNLQPQALSEKLGDKFVSRLIAMCRPIAIKGDDARVQNAEANRNNDLPIIPEFSYQMSRWELK